MLSEYIFQTFILHSTTEFRHECKISNDCVNLKLTLNPNLLIIDNKLKNLLHYLQSKVTKVNFLIFQNKNLKF